MTIKRDLIKYLFGLLILFEISDALLTWFLIRIGIAREGNPFLLNIVGEPTFLIIKVIGVLLAVVILWDINKRSPRVALATTSFFVLFYGVIVFWNLSLFFVG